MFTIKLLCIWVVLFFLGTELYSRRPNGIDVLLDTFYEIKTSSLLIKLIGVAYVCIAIPLTIPKSLYIILKKTNKDGK